MLTVAKPLGGRRSLAVLRRLRHLSFNLQVISQLFVIVAFYGVTSEI